MGRRDSLVGRDRELEELGGLIAAAAAGNGGLLLIAGEAGVGKTTLAEAAISAAGVEAVRGTASPRGSAPFAPISAALRAFLRRSPNGFEDIGPLRAQLTALLPELGASEGRTDREALFEAIRLAFETIGRTEPTVVFLDDLQWADAATLEVLSILAAAAEEWPLLVLGAYRSDEIPRGHPLRGLRTDLRRSGRLAELVVESLDPDSTVLLASEILGAQLGPALGAALVDRTQGIPFFVEELSTALKASSLLVAGKRGLELEASAAVPVPETIRDALRLRTDGLSAEGRATLEAAAVAGTWFELDLLGALGHEAGVAEVLEQELLVEPEAGLASFRHDLAREAVYADTPWPRRRALHRSLAQLLDARGAEPGLVAEHWLAAGERERARPLLVEAARRYCALHANRDAAAAGRAALELWPEGADEAGRLAVLEELGSCAELCGELAEAVRAWEELADAVLGDLPRVGETKRRLAAVYELEGAGPRALTARLEAAEAFAGCDRDADAAAERLLAAERLFGEDREETLRVVERAHEEAVRARRDDLESRCLCFKAFLASKDGRRDEALELARSALSLALAGNHVTEVSEGYWLLGAISNEWGDYPVAQSALEDAAAFCEAHGLHFGRAVLPQLPRCRAPESRRVGRSRADLERRPRFSLSVAARTRPRRVHARADRRRPREDRRRSDVPSAITSSWRGTWHGRHRLPQRVRPCVRRRARRKDRWAVARVPGFAGVPPSSGTHRGAASLGGVVRDAAERCPARSRMRAGSR
jgi:tetratricopeptide (TPR) repeat protein